jgi:hypothetical protein
MNNILRQKEIIALFCSDWFNKIEKDRVSIVLKPNIRRKISFSGIVRQGLNHFEA